jgi:hypothetical protein
VGDEFPYKKGEVDPAWAERVTGMDVFTHNRLNAEDLPTTMVANLAGLQLDFEEQVFEPTRVLEISAGRHVVNLAGSEPALATTLPNIVGAARQAYGSSHDITQGYVDRSTDPQHSSSELWFIPKRGVRILGADELNY